MVRRCKVACRSDVTSVAKQFTEKLRRSTSGAKALIRKERLYRSVEKAAPPKNRVIQQTVRATLILRLTARGCTTGSGQAVSCILPPRRGCAHRRRNDTISRTNPLAAKDPAMSLQRSERQGRGTRFLGRAGGVVRVFHGAVFCPILPRVVYVVPKRQEQAKYDRRGKGFLLFNSLQTVRISASWGKITAGRKVLVLRPPLRLRRCFGKLRLIHRLNR